MKTRANVAAFLSGIVFALGLGISGMTLPSKVLGFLDVAGAWDPSLAFVMIGAIGVHLVVAQWIVRAKVAKPRWGDAFAWPPRKNVDAPLVLGAATFGVGWGMSGICPGPGIVVLVSRAPSALVFFAAMAIGMLAFEALNARAKTSPLADTRL